MRFPKFPFSLSALAALLLGVLSACTAVVVEDPDPFPGSPGYGRGPRICTRDYDPVCARRGGDRRTFGNECQADAAGYSVVRGGECGGRDRPLPPPERLCTREYDPVCARRGGARQTFSNSCQAEEAGYRVIRSGECSDDNEVGDSGGSGSGVCTREYRPVCARNGPSVRTFGNACDARAADFRVISDGPC